MSRTVLGCVTREHPRVSHVLLLCLGLPASVYTYSLDLLYPEFLYASPRLCSYRRRQIAGWLNISLVLFEPDGPSKNLTAFSHSRLGTTCTSIMFWVPGGGEGFTARLCGHRSTSAGVRPWAQRKRKEGTTCRMVGVKVERHGSSSSGPSRWPAHTAMSVAPGRDMGNW